MTHKPNHISQGIIIIRPLLIMFVVIAHTPMMSAGHYINIASSSDWNGFFTIFLKSTFVKGAVPLLSLISGYLAVSTYSKHGYLKTLRKKIKRLILPMLIFNLLIILLIIYPNQLKNPHYRGDLSIAPFQWWGWIKACIGYHTLPANAALYFLKDLFICFLMLPLLDYLAKTRYVNILVLLWLTKKVFFIEKTLFIPSYLTLFFRIDILCAFFLGLMVAHQMKHAEKLKQITDSAWVIAFYLTFCAVIAYMMLIFAKGEQKTLFLIMEFAVKFFGLFCTLVLVKQLLKRRRLVSFLSTLSKYSFSLFLTHVYWLTVWEKWFKHHVGLPKLTEPTGWLFILSCVVFSFICTIIFYQVTNRVGGYLKDLLTKRKVLFWQKVHP